MPCTLPRQRTCLWKPTSRFEVPLNRGGPTERTLCLDPALVKTWSSDAQPAALLPDVERNSENDHRPRDRLLSVRVDSQKHHTVL
jgi:hypothetical protein